MNDLRRSAGGLRLDDEVECPGPRAHAGAQCQDELGPEYEVTPIARLVRKVELGGEDGLVRRLHANVDVPRPSGVEPRDHRFEPVVTLPVGELMPTETEA